VQALAFDPESAHLATGGADGRITLWAADTGKRAFRIVEPENHPDGVTAATRAGSPRAIVFTGGGAYLMAGLTGGGLFLRDRESGHRLWTPPAHAAPVRQLKAVHGGLSLATSGQDGQLVLWDALTGEPLALMAGHDGAATSLAVTPDGARLASGGPDPWVLLWDLPGRTCDMSEAATRRALALYARRALERLGGGRTPD
jgi:WD40 repeat protein